MANYLYITRREHYHDEAGPPIAVEEWLRLVDSDPGLARDPRNPDFILWNHPSRARCNAWLQWRDGNIHSKGPDPPLIRKMTELAERLGATVQGDCSGESYLANGVIQPGPRP